VCSKLLSNHNIHAFITNQENDWYPRPALCLNLLAEDVLERDGVSGELGDALAELLDSHLVLVEVEAECRLVVDVALLLNVERVGVGSVELLGDRLGGVVELLEQVGLVS
jgi:hypothetical protein